MINEIVFLMGTPAAGKSTIGRTLFGATYQIIDCDEFKKSHPDYDPKNPSTTHDWSKAQVREAFKAALEAGTGCYVMDSTGTNAERMAFEIKQAKAAGFTTRLVYVRCSLETSLRRNARRERNVPESIIIEKAETIATSFEIVSKYVDAVQIIENDQDCK